MVFTIMGLFIVWYVPVGLEPVEALLGVPVVRQLPTAATVLLPATTLATVSVRLVFCCCNKINTIFNNMSLTTFTILFGRNIGEINVISSITAIKFINNLLRGTAVYKTLN